MTFPEFDTLEAGDEIGVDVLTSQTVIITSVEKYEDGAELTERIHLANGKSIGRADRIIYNLELVKKKEG